jgi:hypothetical protein
MTDVHDAEDDELAWSAIKPGHRILDRDGEEIGKVHRVLADEGADIFHGVSLRQGMMGPEVEVTADQITRITAERVHTTLGSDDLGALPPSRSG